MNLQGFDDAVHDSSTGLTLAALRGERKQSVQDAGRMLSFLVAKFLQEHVYVAESNYVEIVAGCHEAADGRGISQSQRCQKNYLMLGISSSMISLPLISTGTVNNFEDIMT